MDLIQELLSTFFIILGVIFMMIAALGIIRLPDFYIRMSAITKAGTMGVGLIVIGIAIYFNELIISAKSFVIISFMLLTAPVAAHIIARAAYRQGVPFWGKNLFDELGDEVKKRDDCLRSASGERDNLKRRLGIIGHHLSLPPMLGGSIEEAARVANEILKVDRAEGHRARGIVYSAKRDNILAEQEFKSAVDASGGQNSYRYSLGFFYRDSGMFTEAFAVFEHICRNDRKEIRALFEIGKTSALSGMNSERGEECMNEYINNHPPPRDKFLALASYYTGQIFLNRKEYVMAAEFFEKALSFDKDLHEAAYSLNKLSRKKR